MDFESRKEKKTDFQVHSYVNTEMIMSEWQREHLTIFELLFPAVSKRLMVLNHLNGNEFDLHENTKVKFPFAELCVQSCVAGPKRLLLSACVHGQQLFFNWQDKVFSRLDWIEHVMDGGSCPHQPLFNACFPVQPWEYEYDHLFSGGC